MSKYLEQGTCTLKENDEGERTQLANFTARIIRETRIMDGINTETLLSITGKSTNGTLPEVEILAEQFPGMTWVMRYWGVRAIIQPGGSTKEDLRTAIQTFSQPEVKTIYKAIGWTEINGKRAYLHAGGALTATGNDPSVTTKLPPELQKYNLNAPKKPKEGFNASLMLTYLAPAHIVWPLWTATYAPLFGAVDFATHLTGRSGTFKSELASLFQSHYGHDMDSRHLPGSWSSTGNALEVQAYHAANAVFVIDDFIPVGTAWQVRNYQTTADKIVRAQGNQAGRARLTDTSNLQATYYPRGLIMSTGEDTPEGHSCRARMLISEISPGDIKPADLTNAQKKRPLYSAAMVDLIQDLAKHPVDLTERTNELRAKHIGVGHTRTPQMIGRLIATGEAVLLWAYKKKYIGKDDYEVATKVMTEAIVLCAEQQQKYLENADPVELFLTGLRQVLAGGFGHVRSFNGGVPLKANILGWSEERTHNTMPTWKSHGPCVGWINWDKDELCLDQNIGYAAIKKTMGADLSLTKQTLCKRLKDAGLLTRADEARQRNTVRITAEGHARQVVAMIATSALDTQELPGDDLEEPLPD